MFDVDMMVVIAILSLLFLRQFVIYKQPQKINYAPLLIVIGVIGALVHMMLDPLNDNVLLLFRESLVPLFVSLLMYLVLYILNQTQHSSAVMEQEQLRGAFLKEMAEVKLEVADLSQKIHSISSDELQSFKSVRDVFNEDIKALHVIQDNQKLFMQKFEELTHHQQDGIKGFEEFSNIKMPELDTVVHRHIEMLRIAEQDHYNKIKTALQAVQDQKCDTYEKLKQIDSSIAVLKHSEEQILNRVIEQASGDLKRLFKEYESHLSHLHVKSQTLETSISENEALLDNVKEQSEAVVQQIVVVSKRMDEVIADAQSIAQLHAPIETLEKELYRLKEEFHTVKEEMMAFSKMLLQSRSEDAKNRNDELEKISVQLNEKIDVVLNRLYEQYHIAKNDISSTVQELASRSKIQKTYGSTNHE
jgi:chromosome segregation ATPase